jgi:hypothetical protein
MIKKLSCLSLAGAVVCLACDPRVCTDTAQGTRALPERLSETGLFAELPAQRLGPRVFAYTPQFALWSDGADKRRWVYVPEGERVDSHDAENWRFPEGTKFWKEFSRDGLLLETRLLQRVGPGEADWAATAYLWRADRSEALKAPYGAVDALGTSHDVPASGECFACHDGRGNRVLGFSAIQLASRTDDASVHLAPEAAAELLSEPLPTTLDLPGTASERAALGYLHANCSHCHNQSGAAKAADKCLDPNRQLSFDLDFSLHADELSSTAATATYRTAIDRVVEPGRPNDSKVVELMSRRGAFRQMPPLGTEQVDERGVQLIREWIGAL